jgi:large subunit ribosomal protein L25
MATVKLKTTPRDDLGKQGAKRTRASGRIPAILYGERQPNVAVSIEAHDLRVALSTPAGRNVIIQLLLEGADSTRAVIREMERDPITRDILHVDLQRISENKPVIMHIPVTVVGESVAVKEGRGILDHTMRQLEVKCLPKDIPEHIEVDVSELEVKHAIHVYDITVPDVEILDNPDRPVVEVLQPTLYEEPVAEVAEGEEEPTEGEEAPAAAAEEGAAEAPSESTDEAKSQK